MTQPKTLEQLKADAVAALEAVEAAGGKRQDVNSALRDSDAAKAAKVKLAETKKLPAGVQHLRLIIRTYSTYKAPEFLATLQGLIDAGKLTPGTPIAKGNYDARIDLAGDTVDIVGKAYAKRSTSTGTTGTTVKVSKFTIAKDAVPLSGLKADNSSLPSAAAVVKVAALAFGIDIAARTWSAKPTEQKWTWIIMNKCRDYDAGKVAKLGTDKLVGITIRVRVANSSGEQTVKLTDWLSSQLARYQNLIK